MRTKPLVILVTAAIVLLVGGLLLPSRSEVVRSARFEASPAAVLAELRHLPRAPEWSSWAPSRSAGTLTVTADTARGLWFDVAGRRTRKASVQVEATDAGCEVTWSDVVQLPFDPLARIALLGRDGTVGEELAASLEGLAETLAAGPPTVLVIVIDDLGWPLLERAPTPRLDELAAEGVTFRNLWAAAKCGPTRASLLTGRFHFRIGDGEIARRHRNRSMRLEELLLPEAFGSERSAAFGKWHLSTEPKHPNDSGFGHFAGSLGNLNGSSYTSWPKVVDGLEFTCSRYATTDVTDDAIASDAEFEWVAYHAVHTPFHDPPRDLAPTAERDGTPEGMLPAMTEALDTEIGRLVDAHPGALVFVVGDNGTTSLAGGSKGTVREEGINAPLIVKGPGISRGLVVEDLVHVVDLFATICDLRGIETPREAEDSISFAPVLRGERGAREWNYSCLFWEATPGRRIHAVRDAEYKLIVNYDRSEELYSMPGEVPVKIDAQTREIVERLKALIP